MDSHVKNNGFNAIAASVDDTWQRLDFVTGKRGTGAPALYLQDTTPTQR
jgi:hypothetical protein